MSAPFTDAELREIWGDDVVESVDFATWAAMKEGDYP